ncbi:hypothetical protein CEXT_266111 [Caerostris extrusa]|uniref:Uncharacterized protein n=1 Tax=Caerostris extrusa TaxID=172846 RepID=A0AAV4TYD1_CAEEX|nr:hypothetical protein CEXT_266111 [Caerostris extrusa]
MLCQMNRHLICSIIYQDLQIPSAPIWARKEDKMLSVLQIKCNNLLNNLLNQSTSNKRNISNTNDALTGYSVWNKKMHYCEMNPKESSCQPLDLSIGELRTKRTG